MRQKENKMGGKQQSCTTLNLLQPLCMAVKNTFTWKSPTSYIKNHMDKRSNTWVAWNFKRKEIEDPIVGNSSILKVLENIWVVCFLHNLLRRDDIM